MASDRSSQQAFLGVSVLLGAASVAVTIVWCTSMSAMGAMPMPGGWTMSLAWMRMPGQTWPGAAAPGLGMWVAMLVARMLPSVVPMLAILLVIGVMNLRAMAVVAAVITVARRAPASERVARAIGGVVIGTGLLLIARAAGLG